MSAIKRPEKRGYWPHVLPSRWKSRLIDSCWLLAKRPLLFDYEIQNSHPGLGHKSSFQKLMGMTRVAVPSRLARALAVRLF
jgi:hypothetical protein